MSGLRLGDGVCDVLFIEQHLSLQIGDLDEVAVDDCQVTDAGSGEEFRGHAAKRATPKDERGRIAQTPLPILAEAGKQRLAVVTGKVVTHVWRNLVAHPDSCPTRSPEIDG